jgi:hypothetical protein
MSNGKRPLAFFLGALADCIRGPNPEHSKSDTLIFTCDVLGIQSLRRFLLPRRVCGAWYSRTELRMHFPEALSLTYSIFFYAESVENLSNHAVLGIYVRSCARTF